MKTSRPIASISYNVESYLKLKSDQFVKDGFLDFYFYIYHNGETDIYTGDKRKDHFHVFYMPSKLLQTSELLKELEQRIYTDEEFDPDPLRTMPFRFSTLNDWLLYVLHYEPYLNYKGMSREFHYDDSELVCSMGDEFKFRCLSEALENFNSHFQLFDLAKSGISYAQAFKSGYVTPYNMAFAKELFHLFAQDN